MEAFVWVKVLELSPGLPDFPVDEEEVHTGGIQQRKETEYQREMVLGSEHPFKECSHDLTSPCKA